MVLAVTTCSGTGGGEGKQTLASSISGETGGLSESEPPPLRGPLLWESRPEVSGDTSCCSPAKQETHQLRIQYPQSPEKQSVNRATGVEHQMFVFFSQFLFWFVRGGGLGKKKLSFVLFLLSSLLLPRSTGKSGIR